MKKKVWIWLLSIIGLLVIIAALIYYFMVKPNEDFGDEFFEEGMVVQRISEQSLGESILVTGQVIPEEEQKVFLDPENGEVFEYLVEENQKVTVDEPLFKYDSSKIDAEYNKAVRARDLTSNRLSLEQKEVADMGKRITDMKKKIGGEDGYTQEDVIMLEKEKVQSQMAIENTKDELSSAQESINELSEVKKSMTVVSKIEGTVVKVNKNIEPSETGSSMPVIHIISSEPFKVIGTMSEFDTVKIQPNQAVVIRPKVFKDREWNGVVESISQFPEGEGEMDEYGGGGGNVTMYPFKVAITDDTSELRQGFHVSLEVNISGDGTILAVPHMALTYDEEGQEIVYVLVEEKLEKRVVQTGEMNDEFVGIVEGVADGELIVINPNESMHDGMEVTSYDEVE